MMSVELWGSGDDLRFDEPTQPTSLVVDVGRHAFKRDADAQNWVPGLPFAIEFDAKHDDPGRKVSMVDDTADLRKNLSDQELAVLRDELDKHKRSQALAYILWLVAGMLGIHKFYVGKIRTGIFYVVLGVVGWGSVVSGLVSALDEMTTTRPADFEAFTGIMVLAVIGSICLLVLCVLLIVDLFTIPREIRKRNDRIELNIIESLIKGEGQETPTENSRIPGKP